MSDEKDLDLDWSADAESAELLRLAEQLREAAPPLPADALARVHQQLLAELERAGRWQRRRRLAFGVSIAAAILVAIGGYAMLRSGPGPQLAKRHQAVEPALVEDRITIAVGEGANIAAAGKPLVALDEYRSLFAD
jgi:hypothetical protein